MRLNVLQHPGFATAAGACLDELEVGMAVVDSERVTYANGALLRLTGRTWEELRAEPLSEFLIAPESAPVQNALAHSSAAVSSPQPGLIRRKDGAPIQVLVSTRALGDSARLLMFREDRAIADRETYRDLVEQALLGIYHSRPDGTIVAANPALCRMLGYDSVKELMATSLDAIYVDPDERRRLIARYEAERRTTIEGVEVRWKRRNGEMILVRLSGRANFTSGHQSSFHVIVEDVTERRRLEEILQRTDRLRAMGQLAAGVAHDFNNLLTVVLGHAEILAHHETNAEVLDSAAQIERATRSAAGLTRQLLAFSRQQHLQPARIDVAAAVADARRLIQTILPDSVSLAIPPSRESMHTEIDPIQLEQILLNLAKNAGDAMPAGGTLSIDVTRADLGPDAFGPHLAVQEGAYVELSVRDTGHGMDARTKARIFEPFFSTKPTGQGTGLGLATVYGIVKQSGGFIFVDSTPGVGTRFRVYFPEARTAGEGKRPAPSLRHGPRRMLLVMRDAATRAWAASALTRLGHSVLQASGPDEALALCSAHPVQCLVSDLALPGTDGPALHRRLVRRHGAIKALFLARHGEPLPDSADDLWVVDMPLTMAELGRRVSDVLNEQRL